MLKLLMHGINLVRGKLRNVGDPPRSGKWRTVEQHYMLENAICAACGAHKHLQIHHKKPYHDFPELELDPNNLITLCMSYNRHCHLRLGHGGDFKRYCPDLLQYIEQLHKKEKTFEELWEIAKANTLKN